VKLKNAIELRRWVKRRGFRIVRFYDHQGDAALFDERGRLLIVAGNMKDLRRRVNAIREDGE